MRILRVLLLGPFALIYCVLRGVWAVLDISYTDARHDWRNRRGIYRGRLIGNDSKGDG